MIGSGMKMGLKVVQRDWILGFLFELLAPRGAGVTDPVGLQPGFQLDILSSQGKPTLTDDEASMERSWAGIIWTPGPSSSWKITLGIFTYTNQ